LKEFSFERVQHQMSPASNKRKKPKRGRSQNESSIKQVQQTSNEQYSIKQTIPASTSVMVSISGHKLTPHILLKAASQAQSGLFWKNLAP